MFWLKLRNGVPIASFFHFVNLGDDVVLGEFFEVGGFGEYVFEGELFGFAVYDADVDGCVVSVGVGAAGVVVFAE